ncbi:MAG TPA: hypothetical protein VKV15_10560, partial [Bryobacteraceae bacterium]|nr:hypothetical protein [Bryobacteraceae bacterium]
MNRSMRPSVLWLASSALVCISAVWQLAAPPRRVEGAPLQSARTSVEGGVSIASLAVGHQYREDDWPSIAAAPDGSLWVAWLSFNGQRDDVAARHFQNGRWSNLHWVPNGSGDNWMPQAGVDSRNRVWVVWAAQLNGNWDLYARRFDPAAQEWGPLHRLTDNPLPDINPRMIANQHGHFALVWQGFRDKKSHIFLKTFDGERWSETVRVTNGDANDWDPAVAFDSRGAVWIAYDSFRNGNYDVFLSQVRDGRVEGREIPVAATARF